jgi:hypothetical protein
MNAPTCTDSQQKKGFEMTNCNQGQDYPLRVARIGQRMKSADPLPPSIWRQQLRRLGYWALMGIIGMLWMAFLVACAAYAT